MEWNAEWKHTEWMWHTRRMIGHGLGLSGGSRSRIGWRLSLFLSLTMTTGDDVGANGVILPSSTPTDTLVRSSRAYTRVLCRVLHGSSSPGFRGGGWWWRWMDTRTHTHGVIGVDDAAWIHLRPLPPPTCLWTRMMMRTIDDHRRPLNATGYTLHSPARPPRLSPRVPNRADANTGVIPNWVHSLGDTDTAGPNRAHDRPPSRTTKTATLYTNPATSWQIDVRDYINTLIVVDLSKSQVDYN